MFLTQMTGLQVLSLLKFIRDRRAMLPAKHSVNVCPGAPESRPEPLAEGDQTLENGVTVTICIYIAAVSDIYSVYVMCWA